MPIYDHDGTTYYEIGKLYDDDGTTNYQTGKVYDNDGTTSSLIYSAEETVGLSISGACGHDTSESYKTYEKSYTVPAGWEKATVTSFGINEWVYGDTTGYLYYNGTLIGTRSSTYYGGGNSVRDSMSVPKSFNVAAGGVIKVTVKGWTNAGVMSVNQNCSVSATIVLE